jgi:hypothetical protein
MKPLELGVGYAPVIPTFFYAVHAYRSFWNNRVSNRAFVANAFKQDTKGDEVTMTLIQSFIITICAAPIIYAIFVTPRGMDDTGVA